MCGSSQEMTKTTMFRPRRGKRDKYGLPILPVSNRRGGQVKRKPKQEPGLMAILPSLAGVAVLAFGVMAKMGFRGRATVAGIDLGTTNSVVCVQVPAKGVGQIDCIPDPSTGSPIIPSVVSFLEPWERPVGPSSKVPSLIDPHPSHVVVGQVAKRRIDSHPHHTLYNAKRVLGRPASDPSIQELKREVEFGIRETGQGVVFSIPESERTIAPEQVGSYVVNYLMHITKAFLGHDNVKSAVICVPAKFDAQQRMMTQMAFKNAGISVARVVEEPVAAALAYGLHKKEDVDYILVYDFGGGTLDVSLLQVSKGFVDVMGSDGDDRLGGADFDAAIAHHLVDKHGDMLQHIDLEEKLYPLCEQLQDIPLCTLTSFHTLGEQLKIQLSDYPDGDGVASTKCYALGMDILKNSSLNDLCSTLETVTLTINSDEYDRVSQSLFDRSVEPVYRLLNDLDLKENDIDEVVMVGGTTRMPQIRRLVQKALPTASINTHIDPDITVAYGAASVID